MWDLWTGNKIRPSLPLANPLPLKTTYRSHFQKAPAKPQTETAKSTRQLSSLYFRQKLSSDKHLLTKSLKPNQNRINLKITTCTVENNPKTELQGMFKSYESKNKEFYEDRQEEGMLNLGQFKYI